MNRKIEIVKDVLGNDYNGLSIQIDELYPFLDKMKLILGDEYDEYVRLQQERDNYSYHCTLFNPMEYGKIISDINNLDKLNSLLDKVVIDDFKLLGLGRVEKNENIAYFVVCKSNDMQFIRKSFSLNEKDFHITIGFKFKDVHGVAKNEILPYVDPFLMELKKAYIINNSFEFIHELPNYTYDLNDRIYIINIKDTYATFRVDTNYFVVSLIDDKLAIACKWQDNTNINYLSDTLIKRKLNIN
jgi:hypothetical protein